MPKVYLPIVETPSYLKAIRAKCLECSENSTAVRECHIVGCPLFPFRFGRGIDSAKTYWQNLGYEVVMINVEGHKYLEDVLTKKRKNRF